MGKKMNVTILDLKELNICKLEESKKNILNEKVKKINKNINKEKELICLEDDIVKEVSFYLQKIDSSLVSYRENIIIEIQTKKELKKKEHNQCCIDRLKNEGKELKSGMAVYKKDYICISGCCSDCDTYWEIKVNKLKRDNNYDYISEIISSNKGHETKIIIGKNKFIKMKKASFFKRFKSFLHC